MNLPWPFRKRAATPQTNGRYRHGNSHLIELRRVAKTFQTAAGTFTALKGIDLQVDRGEFVAIIGKSGSGKSTLVNMITGIDRPTSGEVYVGDTAVHTLNEGQLAVWRGKHLGVIFQFFQLLPTLTLLENVMLPMDFGNVGTASERRERAMALLERVEMADHASKLPSGCSGGQQQRVAIARALANDPQLILADEPTGNLDSRTAGAIFDLFQGLVAGGKTICMVTHDRDLSRRVTRSIVLVDGEIVEELRTAAADTPGVTPTSGQPPTPPTSTEPAREPALA
ncbi:MAG TPA: ABC transporter ATP-binding protein [Chloroflexota bacterium]|nr:ABC transporter ATP-binding protein [Chloroflexota bacterium]